MRIVKAAYSKFRLIVVVVFFNVGLVLGGEEFGAPGQPENSDLGVSGPCASDSVWGDLRPVIRNTIFSVVSGVFKVTTAAIWH